MRFVDGVLESVPQRASSGEVVEVDSGEAERLEGFVGVMCQVIGYWSLTCLDFLFRNFLSCHVKRAGAS